MVDIEYANAYSEVLEILSYISKEDYNKIPEEKIELFEKECNKEYSFHYDITKTLEEQNVSSKAKTIIAILFRDYWATDLQRQKIKAKEEYDRQIVKQKAEEKYSINELDQDNENSNIKVEEKTNELIVYKEPFIKRIVDKILKWFKLR